MVYKCVPYNPELDYMNIIINQNLALCTLFIVLKAVRKEMSVCSELKNIEKTFGVKVILVLISLIL